MGTLPGGQCVGTASAPSHPCHCMLHPCPGHSTACLQTTHTLHHSPSSVHQDPSTPYPCPSLNFPTCTTGTVTAALPCQWVAVEPDEAAGGRLSRPWGEGAAQRRQGYRWRGWHAFPTQGTPRRGPSLSARLSALQPAWGRMFHHESLSTIPREVGPWSLLRAFQSGEPVHSVLLLCPTPPAPPGSWGLYFLPAEVL